MSILDMMNESCIDTNLNASTRDEALSRVAELARKSEILRRHKAGEIFDALVEREKMGTTGFGEGIAIPHCSFRDLEGFVVGFCRIPEGADFHALDGKPVYALFFIIGPESDRNRHIQILSSVSKILADPDNAESLRKAETAAEVLDIVRKEIAVSRDLEPAKDRCLFQIIVQREEYFDKVLSILSADVEGDITVLEGHNAGYYLHRMPLFSAYWTEDSHSFNRIILAVADRRVCNDIIRRINLISADSRREGGILVTAQDLLYSGGSLDF